MVGIFITHIVDLFRRKKREYGSWKALLLGPDTMLMNKKDLQDVRDSFKWFVGMGPRPQYGRWTYWEKFDYFAVFWGMIVIGSTGLTLWFPEFFTLVLPGWALNVATIIHSDEALLATGFIFTVHFFNTHLRPEKFPMDMVIFTGRMDVEELKEDKPEEYREGSGRRDAGIAPGGAVSADRDQGDPGLCLDRAGDRVQYCGLDHLCYGFCVPVITGGKLFFFAVHSGINTNFLKEGSMRIAITAIAIVVAIVFVAGTVAAENKYIGTKTCAMCHKAKDKGEAFAIWQKSQACGCIPDAAE